jgi:hypothetical protein
MEAFKNPAACDILPSVMPQPPILRFRRWLNSEDS